MTRQELLEPIIEFLIDHAPFDEIGREGCSSVARSLEVKYSRRGTEIQAMGRPVEFAYIVRSGALSELDASEQLLARHGEGDCANVEELLGARPSTTTLVCHEDTLLYSIPASQFRQLCQKYPPLAHGFSSSLTERLRLASIQPATFDAPLGGTTAKVSALLHRELVTVDRGTPISDAAKTMRDRRVSALIVTGGDELGIVTDRDLRVRVVATGRSLKEPIASVMTSPIFSVESHVPIFEALLVMLDAEVHHLVIMNGSQPAGMISTTDFIRLETENPVHVVRDLRKQENLGGLIQVVERRRDRVLERLVNSGARAMDIHRVLTLIGDAVTRRLIDLAERELPQIGLGPMPDYCWVALGSQARNELNLGSDQDNAIILGAKTHPDDPAARWLAETVCEGLAACGYPKCPGDVMASTDTWRQPIENWQSTFERWIRSPEKLATMHASIFFDMRGVAGTNELVTRLLEEVGPEAKRQSIFLAHMAHNAMSLRPPLGLFRQFVLEKGGEHKDTLDLKHRGLAPVVGLARLFALEAGYSGPNTLERINAACQWGGISAEGASELESAFEFISILRLRHQAQCLKNGTSPNSFVAPDTLTSTDRRHLRDAFRAIKSMQDSVQVSRQLGAFG